MAQIAPFDDFSHSPKHYVDAARHGDAEAQFYLGLALERLGPDAEARWGAARDWIARAAKGGLPQAQHRMAQIALDDGDLTMARANFAAAAANGITEAQFNLGRMATERGDLAEARRAYTMAARAGHGPSQFNLALLFLESDAENAPAHALAWLTLAAEHGTPNASAAYAALRAELPVDQRAEAQRLAEGWR